MIQEPGPNMVLPEWDVFKNYLIFDLKQSSKPAALSASKYRYLELMKYFAGIELNRSNFTQFIALRNSEGIAKSSLNKYISLTKNIAKYFGVKGFEDITYFREPTKKDVDVLTWEEMDKLAKVYVWYKTNKLGVTSQEQNFRFNCLYRILSEVGCRISEALELRWSEVNGRTIRFLDTKNGDDREVRITPQLADMMALLPHEGRVFGLQYPNNINLDLKRRAKVIGLHKPVYVHVFRHSVITNLLAAGAPIHYVQELVGHRDINTTIRYNHTQQDEIEQMLFSYSGAWRGRQSFSQLAIQVKEVLNKLIDSSVFSVSINESPAEFSISIKETT